MTDPIDNDVSKYVSSMVADEIDEGMWGPDAALADRMHVAIENITYRPNYEIEHGRDEHGLWIEVTHFRPDAVTGEWGTGRGGKRYLTTEMSVSDIVRNVFGALLAYEEHEVREFFRYAGEQIFSPHMNLNALAMYLKARRDG